MTSSYYHPTSVDYLPGLMEKGLLRGRHESESAGPILFPTKEQATKLGEEMYGTAARLVAVPVTAFQIVPPDRVPMISGMGGVLAINDIPPEHLRLVTKPPRRAGPEPTSRLASSPEEIILRQGFVKADIPPAGSRASYVRHLEGAAIEFRIENDTDAGLYLHEGDRVVLLRDWDLDKYDSTLQVLSEMFSFADGVEAYRAAHTEYGHTWDGRL